VSPSLTTFVFEVANFLGLALVLAWLFFKPVRKALEDQQARARAQEEEAARRLAEADGVRKEVEAQRRRLEAEADETRARAKEAAGKEAEAILAEARAHAEHERTETKRQALNIERAQLAALARSVATVAQEAVQRLLGQLQGPELERALLQAACRQLQGFADRPRAPVVVESASPLDPSARQQIESALGREKPAVEFRVVEELGGGLRIRTAQGLIDASIDGLANFAERSLLDELEALAREETSGA
jgi:F-type H+-transporting ATPase subunit b